MGKDFTLETARERRWEESSETSARRGLQSRGSAQTQTNFLLKFIMHVYERDKASQRAVLAHKRVHHRKHLAIKRGLHTETQLLLIMFLKRRQMHAAAAQHMIQTYRTEGLHMLVERRDVSPNSGSKAWNNSDLLNKGSPCSHLFDQNTVKLLNMSTV